VTGYLQLPVLVGGPGDGKVFLVPDSERTVVYAFAESEELVPSRRPPESVPMGRWLYHKRLMGGPHGRGIRLRAYVWDGLRDEDGEVRAWDHLVQRAMRITEDEKHVR
jgi:hypothetical protein